MKLFIISDIHGSRHFTRLALEKFREEEADYIVILGDILYHGARNPLPYGHDPKGVIELLNAYSEKIIGVRGNCDSEVDQMVLNFPLMADYNNLILGSRRIFISHGHLYSKENLPGLEAGSVFLYGHTHILRAEEEAGIYYLNPGSISLPKADNPPSYGLLDEGSFLVKDFENRILKAIDFD